MAQPPPDAVHHYSPASVGGSDSQRLAKQVSSAYADVYRRTKRGVNGAVEQLQYLPPGQPQDDIWSGSAVDEGFWRANADVIISRKATGITREQRSAIDRAAPEQPPPVGGAAPVQFCECTKSKSRRA
eukprot:jgi/Tetstr1/464117/TSEL_008922.t1